MGGLRVPVLRRGSAPRVVLGLAVLRLAVLGLAVLRLPVLGLPVLGLAVLRRRCAPGVLRGLLRLAPGVTGRRLVLRTRLPVLRLPVLRLAVLRLAMLGLPVLLRRLAVLRRRCAPGVLGRLLRCTPRVLLGLPVLGLPVLLLRRLAVLGLAVLLRWCAPRVLRGLLRLLRCAPGVAGRRLVLRSGLPVLRLARRRRRWNPWRLLVLVTTRTARSAAARARQVGAAAQAEQIARLERFVTDRTVQGRHDTSPARTPARSSVVVRCSMSPLRGIPM